jgi:hypothetical protein
LDKRDLARHVIAHHQPLLHHWLSKILNIKIENEEVGEV